MQSTPLLSFIFLSASRVVNAALRELGVVLLLQLLFFAFSAHFEIRSKALGACGVEELQQYIYIYKLCGLMNSMGYVRSRQTDRLGNFGRFSNFYIRLHGDV